jgi:hypothetical protein
MLLVYGFLTQKARQDWPAAAKTMAYSPLTKASLTIIKPENGLF